MPGAFSLSRPAPEPLPIGGSRLHGNVFVRINDTGPVDIWAVDDVDPVDLIEAGSGYSYVRYRIGAHRLDLQDQEVTEDDVPSLVTIHGGSSTAYSSSLTITLDDGTELRGDDAHALVARRPVSDDQ